MKAALRNCLCGLVALALYSCNNNADYDHSSIYKIPYKAKEYVVVVNKSEHYLDLRQYNPASNTLEVMKRYRCATGAKKGDKQKADDLRTPEGNYRIKQIMDVNRVTASDLYGPKALVLDYPNSYDKARGKTGSGIWIHGTDESSSIGLNATRGCIRLCNSDLLELSDYVGEDTKVIIRERI